MISKDVAIARKQIAWKLYQAGQLLPTDPSIAARGLSQQEVEVIDAAGKLIGTKGFATMFAACLECHWHDHEHHHDDPHDYAEACSLLSSIHEEMQPSCEGRLVFEEHKG